VGDCFCIRGKSERARAIQMPRGRRICVKNGAGTRFYHRYHGNSLAPQGLVLLVDENATARRKAGPLSKINAKTTANGLLGVLFRHFFRRR
jgi:hypothetical protein